MTLTINGKSTSQLGIVLLAGWVDALHSSCKRKKLIENASAAIDGTRALTRGRKVESRTFSLKAYIVGGDTESALMQKIEALDELFVVGVPYTGVNELHIVEEARTYRCAYNGYDTFRSFTRGTAVISLHFTELNPANRK